MNSTKEFNQSTLNCKSDKLWIPIVFLWAVIA